MKHVTTHDAAHLERNPFPELHRPPPHVDSGSWEEEDLDTMDRKTRKKAMAKDKAASASAKSSPRPLTEDHPGAHNGSDVKLYTQAVRDTADEVAADNAAVDKLPESPKDDYANGHSIVSAFHMMYNHHAAKIKIDTLSYSFQSLEISKA